MFKVGSTFGLHFANSAVSTTHTGDGVHHCIFWGLCVCVFALVFASNVGVVKVRPLLVRRSFKNRSLENCCCHDGEESLMSPTI